MSLSIEEANCFKLTVVFAVLWSTLVLASSSPARTADDDAGVEETFKRYMKTYNKPYQVGSHEYEQRLEIFKVGLAGIIKWLCGVTLEASLPHSRGSLPHPPGSFPQQLQSVTKLVPSPPSMEFQTHTTIHARVPGYVPCLKLRLADHGV